MTLIQTDPATAGSPPTTAFTPCDGRLSSAAVEFDGVSRRFGDVLALDDLHLGSGPARPSPCSARTAPASRPRSGSCSGSSSRRAGRLGPRPVAARCGRQRPGRLHAPATGLPTNVRVGELVEFARRLYPHPLSQAAVLERAGLTALSDRSVDRLSGGESPAPPVRLGHRRRSGPRLPRRADGRDGRRDAAGVLGGHAPLARARVGRSCSRRTTSRRPTRSPTGSSSSTTAGSSRTARAVSIRARIVSPDRPVRRLPAPTRPPRRRCPASRRSTSGATPSGWSRTTRTHRPRDLPDGPADPRPRGDGRRPRGRLHRPHIAPRPTRQEAIR